MIADKKSRPEYTEAAAITPNYSLAYLDEKSSIKSVIPDSIYYFKRKPGAGTRFLLQGIEGDEISNFPSTYKRGAAKGQKYIGFRKTEAYHLKKWTHSLELENARMFTGVNLKKGRDGKGRGFGDDRNLGRRDCVLVELSEDGQSLNIAFIFGKADRAEEVYQAWIEDIERGRNVS